MKWLIAILLLVTVLIAGCTTLSSIGTTNIGDIQKNPEKYENKTISIVGGTPAAFPMLMRLIDDQGYFLDLAKCGEGRRTLDYGRYKATGIINYSVTCNCQYRFVANLTKEDLEYLQEKYNVSQIYKDNVTCGLMGNCLLAFAISPEEGWQNSGGIMEERIDPLNCKSYLSGTENYKIFFNRDIVNSSSGIIIKPASGIEGFTEQIMERRCEPNSTQKNYYLECTESMVKIS